jgi:hypothetical protein
LDVCIDAQMPRALLLPKRSLTRCQKEKCAQRDRVSRSLATRVRSAPSSQDKKWWIVDLPGYGFAKATAEETQKWETFTKVRVPLTRVKDSTVRRVHTLIFSYFLTRS